MRHVVTDARGRGEARRTGRRRDPASWSAPDAAGLDALSTRRCAEPADFAPDGRHPRRAIRCCSTSPPAPPRSPSWCCTPTRAIRWATCRRCTGSACARATCTGTSARPAGPSTPGAASSRRGTRRHRLRLQLRRASTRGGLLETLRALRRDHALRAADGVAHADPARTSAPGRSRCARSVSAGEPLNPEVIERVRQRLGPHDPRRLRPDRDHGAGRQPAGPAGQARLDGQAAARLPRRAARRRRRARPTRARSPSRSTRRPLGLMARLPRRRGARGRRRCAAATTAPATWPRATPTATSPTSAAPTTCSRAPTTGSARSSWRAR